METAFKTLALTDYMNRSIYFRGKLTKYCIEKGNEAQETRNTLHLLDAMDNKAKDDLEYRYKVYVWMFGGTGTLELRDLANELGFDYWESIKNSNIIDTFDSFQGYF